MTSTDGVSGAGAANLASVVGDPGMIDLSPEGLIAFCAQQLGEVNSEISDQMKAQQVALKQRQALHGALSVLNGFGTDGPQTIADMQKCVEAIKNAQAQLTPTDPNAPPDPVAEQLGDFLKKMTSDYNYTPPTALTPDQQAERQQAKDELASGVNASVDVTAPAANGVPAHTLQTDDPQGTIDRLNQLENGSFTKPNKDAKQWAGTTQALTDMGSDIKDNAEIQMLQLNDLISQKQQIVQQANSMLSKEDQTLEDLAKAIGH